MVSSFLTSKFQVSPTFLSPSLLAAEKATIRCATRIDDDQVQRENIVIIGGGWGGLSSAYALYKHNRNNHEKKYSITLVEASPRVGGLVRDGFTSVNGLFQAEAGQHGFWDNYHNIFQLLDELPNVEIDDVLTGYDEQGQYSPKGLEAVWPVYRDMNPSLPTGLAQAIYTN